MSKKEVLIIFGIALAMGSRFLFIVDGQSILPNFTAVGAIAILGATYLKGIKKWIVPITVLWLSDLLLNNMIYKEYYPHFQIFGSYWVYGSILLIGVVGYLLMKKASWTRLAVTSILAAVIFFLITNFGVWLSNTSPYSKDLSGLIQSYQAGLPFFRNALLGNLFYGFALFGIYEFLANRVRYLDPMLSKSSVAE